jgi:hypothetical protein
MASAVMRGRRRSPRRAKSSRGRCDRASALQRSAEPPRHLAPQHRTQAQKPSICAPTPSNVQPSKLGIQDRWPSARRRSQRDAHRAWLRPETSPQGTPCEPLVRATPYCFLNIVGNDRLEGISFRTVLARSIITERNAHSIARRTALRCIHRDAVGYHSRFSGAGAANRWLSG